MSIGKYLSLEEARNHKKIDRFLKEHPSTGDAEVFDALFNAMANPKKASQQKAQLKIPKTRTRQKQR